MKMQESQPRTRPRIAIYVFNGAEVVDWAAPYGVMAVARRLDPEVEVFLISDSGAAITATGNLNTTPRYGLDHGMIVEYWNAVSGAVDDYGLNINDNTPLFILALNHH
jgi:hypothetical protein